MDEDKQRRNRFYFYLIFWIISVDVFYYLGYSVARAEVKSKRNHSKEQLSLVVNKDLFKAL